MMNANRLILLLGIIIALLLGIVGYLLLYQNQAPAPGAGSLIPDSQPSKNKQPSNTQNGIGDYEDFKRYESQ